MANAMEQIGTMVLSSAQSLVEFPNIPQGVYKDLVLVSNVKMTQGSDAVRMQFNSDTGSNYSSVWMVGTGSSASAGQESNTGGLRVGGAAVGLTTSSSDSIIVSIMDAFSTTNHKTTLTRYSGAGTEVVFLTGRWASLSAVTSVRLYGVVNSIAAGSTFSLFGVKA